MNRTVRKSKRLPMRKIYPLLDNVGSGNFVSHLRFCFSYNVASRDNCKETEILAVAWNFGAHG